MRIGISKDGITDAVIPDSMLENSGAGQDYNIYAFVYLTNNKTGNTEYRITIPVQSRPKPEVLPESGETSLESIMKAVNEIADEKADALDYKDSVLSLISGDKTLSTVTIRGGSGGADAREIELRKSETAIQWRYKGDADWINLVLLEDIAGKQGIPGKDGKAITSVVIKADGHLQINYSDDTNVDVGKVVGENGLNGASGIPVRVEKTAEDTVVELKPNILYVFPEMTSLTYTLAIPDDTSVANEYHFIFKSGATATEMVHPENINIGNFTIDSNKTYEISILDGLLVSQNWSAG